MRRRFSSSEMRWRSNAASKVADKQRPFCGSRRLTSSSAQGVMWLARRTSGMLRPVMQQRWR